MLIKRKLERVFRQALKEYPVVTLFGPRQSGKTTLAKMCCPRFNYVNLEDQEARDLARRDYKAFFSRFQPPVVIDEIQNVPELTSAIQILVDSDRHTNGRFVLTGSHQTALTAAVDQSLAGRTSVLELLPLSFTEIKNANKLSSDRLMLKGFMPELYASKKDSVNYYRNYLRTYVERDVRRLVNIRDLIVFERFLSLLAGRIGQVVNFASLANDTGVSATTISSWVSILEASFIIYRLPPFFANISKRLVKSPKIYFTETGLATYLLGIEDESHLMAHPLRGNIFENMAVIEARKSFSNEGKEPRLSFLRTGKGFEIDLVVSKGINIQPVEIKSAMTFNGNLVRNLEMFSKEYPSAVDPTLVYDGDNIPSFGPCSVNVVNIRQWGIKK